MDLSYQQPQPYRAYETSQWSEDYKQAYNEGEIDLSYEDKSSASATPVDFTADHQHRRHSILKVEDDSMWHSRPHGSHAAYPIRHYSQAAVPTHHHAQPYARVDPNFPAPYAQAQWPVSHSGTSTPTPVYGSVDSYNAPVQYANHVGFNFNADPISAVSMSPQSSQGGWASATSSDGVEQRCTIQSPAYRPVSPQLVVRPDGIRKKNARFEIPKERNLQTIDAMIMNSTDETEKKELKQQKRLLRNRQAALDSRQRKKTHTEKLEQEKKHSEKRMVDLETFYEQMQEQLQHERDQFMVQRQQYDIQLKQVMHERDEAIRLKTIEAADTRKQLNAMREYIRELPQRPIGYAPAAEMHHIASEFSEITFNDDWENEFSLLGEDLSDREADAMQRQTTPKPLQPLHHKKPDIDFSWKTFYMCLAFGAVVVAAGGHLANLAKSSTDITLPPVSDEYRADAQNVLNAVRLSSPQSAQDMVPTRSAAAATLTDTNTMDSVSSFSQTAAIKPSDLDQLSSTLATPSRHHQLQQAFAMTPASYNHIMDPMSEFDDDADADLPDSPMSRPPPSRLAQAYAAFNAQKPDFEKQGYQSRAHERSALSVPESVMSDFRVFVHECEQSHTTESAQT